MYKNSMNYQNWNINSTGSISKFLLNTSFQFSTCFGLSWLPTCAVTTPFGFNTLLFDPYCLQLDQYKIDHHSNQCIFYHKCQSLFLYAQMRLPKHISQNFFCSFLSNCSKMFIAYLNNFWTSSYQSINPKFLKYIHATPPSPPPIIAALDGFNFNPELTKVELYKCSSLRPLVNLYQ